MRLIRWGDYGREKPGLLDSKGMRRDCSAFFTDFNAAFFADDGPRSLYKIFSEIEKLPVVADSERWGAPIARPGKIICIGLNYRDHAKESGMEIPTEPVVFCKAPNTVIGPYDNVIIPRRSEQTDWEVELAVVIGKTARYLDSLASAWNCIAGYCISNDISERHFQLHCGGQWVKGKSCDTFNPLGPWLATPDEIANVGNLRMSLNVNEARMQTGNTENMVFTVDFIVHYLSQFMTLEPGDLISTGTPPGVGLGRQPPMFLQPGDVMELSIEHLGVQRQICERAT